MPINNYLAWILVSGHPHAKPYKVVSLKGLSSETLMCSLYTEAHLTCIRPARRVHLYAWYALAEVAILSCILKHCRETRSVGNTVGTRIQVYSQDNPFFKNFKGQTLRIWQLHIQNIFSYFLYLLMAICKTWTQFCACTSLKIQYELFNETDDFIWPILGWAECSINHPYFSPLPMSDSFKHSYLTLRCLTKDR